MAIPAFQKVRVRFPGQSVLEQRPQMAAAADQYYLETVQPLPVCRLVGATTTSKLSTRGQPNLSARLHAGCHDHQQWCRDARTITYAP